MSVRGRSYGDPSYGSEKTLYSQLWTAGTRAAAALIEKMSAPMSPIEVVDWNILNTVTGTGGVSVWILAATSSLGTHNIGTLTQAGTIAANVYTEGTIVTTGTTHLVGAGGELNLYSGLTTAEPLLIVRHNIQYQEHYVQGNT